MRNETGMKLGVTWNMGSTVLAAGALINQFESTLHLTPYKNTLH